MMMSAASRVKSAARSRMTMGARMAQFPSTDMTVCRSSSRRVRVLGAAAASLISLSAIAAAGSPEGGAPRPAAGSASCPSVRLSDIGWTDVTATTAVFAALLEHLGYRPEITVLSVPVTYASMKNNDIGVFLGCHPWRATDMLTWRTVRWK